MKRMKRLFSLILSTTMVLSMLTVNTYAASSFSDTKNHWAQSAIENLAEKGIVSGMGDGTFAPNKNVTRAEFATMINKAYDFDTKGDLNFTDVPANAWYKTNVQIAVGEKYMAGYTDNTFKPTNKITRAEAAQIAYAVSGIDDSTGASDKYGDASSIPSWAKPAIDAVTAAGLFGGDEKGNFRASSNLTRAEAAVVITKLLGTDATTANPKDDVVITGTTFGSATGDPTVVKGNLTVMNADTTVENVIVNGDLIIDKNVGNGDVTLTNITVKGTTQVFGGGANSIHVKDSTLAKVLINKADGNVRFVTTGKTTVDTVKFSSGGKLVNDGGTINNVEIASDVPNNASVTISGDVAKLDVLASVALSLLNGTIGQLTISADAAGSTIAADATSKVTLAVINAIITITGKGVIATATITVSGVKIETAPTKLTNDSIAPSTYTPPTGGGGGGGGGTTTTRSSDASVKSIVVNGISAEAISTTAAQTNANVYEVVLASQSDVTNLTSGAIVVTTNNAYALVGQKIATDSNNTIWDFTVTAQNGNSEKYRLYVYAQGNMYSSDATVKSVVVNQRPATPSQTAANTYDVVLASQSDVTNLTSSAIVITANQANAIVGEAQPTAATNTIWKFTVTAQNGNSVTYTLNVSAPVPTTALPANALQAITSGSGIAVAVDLTKYSSLVAGHKYSISVYTTDSAIAAELVSVASGSAITIGGNNTNTKAFEFTAAQGLDSVNIGTTCSNSMTKDLYVTITDVTAQNSTSVVTKIVYTPSSRLGFIAINADSGSTVIQ